MDRPIQGNCNFKRERHQLFKFGEGFFEITDYVPTSELIWTSWLKKKLSQERPFIVGGKIQTIHNG